MPTLYTDFDAAKSAIQMNGGFIIETDLGREWWLAADYIEAVEILAWAGGSREQAFSYLLAHPAFRDNVVVRSCDFAASFVR